MNNKVARSNLYKLVSKQTNNGTFRCPNRIVLQVNSLVERVLPSRRDLKLKFTGRGDIAVVNENKRKMQDILLILSNPEFVDEQPPRHLVQPTLFIFGFKHADPIRDF